MKSQQKKKGDNMKKIMMIAVIAMAAFMVMPSVSALELKDVNDITTTGPTKNYNAAKKSTNERTTTFDIENTNLVVVDKTVGNANRPQGDTAWFGVGVEAPDSDVSTVCWKRGYTNDHGDECTTATADGQHNDYTLWIPFTAEEMKAEIEQNGENAIITKTATIYWNGEDGDNYQEIIVRLHASTVQLVIDESLSGTVSPTAAFTEEDKEAAMEVYNENHKPEVVEPQTTEEKKDEANPDTADINLYLLLSLVITSGCGIAYSVRKRFN